MAEGDKVSEHAEQCAVIEWAQLMVNTGQWPQLEWLHAIPNGGHRNKVTAGKMKAEGVKSGVPDLHLPVPVPPYAGCYIEMKFDKNKPTDNQKKWIAGLRCLGHRVEVCFSAGEAMEVLISYLQGEI